MPKKGRKPKYGIVSADQLREWRMLLARIDREIAAKQVERERLSTMIGVAYSFVTGAPPAAEPNSGASSKANKQRVQSKSKYKRPPDPPTVVPGSWSDRMWTLVQTFSKPFTYDELREEIDRKFPDDDRGSNYMSAVQRLRQSGHLLDYKGHLCVWSTLDRFVAAVKAGLMEDVEDPQTNWANEVAAIVDAHGKDMASTEIIAKLKENPVLAMKLTRSPSLAHSGIRTLLKEGRLLKIDRGLYRSSKSDRVINLMDALRTSIRERQVSVAQSPKKASQGDSG